MPLSPLCENPAPTATAKALQVVNPLSTDDWNQRVLAHEGFSFFHTAEWARVLHATYGYTPCYLAVTRGAGGQALWPLMEVRSVLGGRRGVGLPFSDYCEPLVEGEASDEDRFREVVRFGEVRHWHTIELRGRRGVPREAPAARRYCGHNLALDADDETLFARCEGSVRQAVRKATREGVRTEVADSIEAVRAFYRLQCQTRRTHGLPPQPLRFFENIQRFILAPGLGFVVLGFHEDKVIAGAVFFVLGRKALFKFGASDPRFQHLRGNNLVMWEGLRACARRGGKTLSLGRTGMDEEGLRRFKLGWGAEEAMIEYIKYDLPHQAFLVEKDLVSGWHNALFRRLPISLSRLVGAALYRYAG